MRSSLPLAFCLFLAGAAQAQDLNVITGVDVRDEGNSVLVTVKGSKPPNFTTFSMADPARFVIDLSEARFEGVPEDLRPGDGVIRVVKNLSYGTGPTAIARVMLAFSADVESPEVQTEGNSLLVRVARPAGAAVAAAGSAGTATPAATAAPAAVATAAPVAAATAAPASAATAAPAAAASAAPAAASAASAGGAVASTVASAGADAGAATAAAAAAAKAEADESARREALAQEQREAEARLAAEADARAREAEKIAAEAAQARKVQEAAAAAAVAAAAQAEIDAKAKREVEEALAAEQAAEARARASAAEQAAAARAAVVEALPVPASAPPPAAPPPVTPEKVATLATPEVPPRQARLQAIGFQQLPTVSRVFVRTNVAPRFTITDVGDDVVRLEVENTRAARRNDTRPLDTSFFPSAVAMITPSKRGTSYVVDIKLRKRVPYQQKVEGDVLAIDFERTPSGQAPGDAEAPAAAQVPEAGMQENQQGMVVSPDDKAEGAEPAGEAEPATEPATEPPAKQ